MGFSSWYILAYQSKYIWAYLVKYEGMVNIDQKPKL